MPRSRECQVVNVSWQRWSLRTRLMVIGLLGLAAAQAVGSVALAAALHVGAEHRIEQSAHATSAEVIDLIKAGNLPATLAASGLEIVQVVDDGDRVVSASQNADRLTALLSPGEVAQALRGPVRVPGSRVAIDSELRVWAQQVSAGGNRLTVVVAEPDEELLSSDALLRRVLLITFPLLLVVLGLIAWRVIGAAMRPVEELRSAAERISGSGRGDRLPVPPSEDEVHALAVTLNSMLDRLDRARERETSFVGDAAHELRSPLASMRMEIDVARRLGEGGSLAEDLHEDVARLDALVDDLLMLARLDAVAGWPVPGARVPVRPALHRVASACSSDRARVRVLPGEDVAVTVGEGELDRILTNLVGNATRHARRVDLSVARHQDRGVITVVDDGPGIPLADRERVFERFTRLDEARDRDSGGAGLGLAIVKELVRARGGELRLGDAEGGGLRVDVELPAAAR
ncbi:MAG TPA: ATP-binding protein [Nocardioides sp.]|nr:ATP-binding protein [Nocardioides sp.]